MEYLDEDAELFHDGSVHDATLARDTEIQGVPCAGRRSVVYFPGGRLRLSWLSRPATIGAVACAPGIVYLHENGGLLNATLAAPHVFAGVAVPAGERVTLDEQGQLLEHSGRLSADQPVGGLPCSAEFHVWLYPGGRLSAVVLAAPALVGGREYPRGAELFLGENGQVLDCRLVDLDSGRRYQQRVFGCTTPRSSSPPPNHPLQLTRPADSLLGNYSCLVRAEQLSGVVGRTNSGSHSETIRRVTQPPLRLLHTETSLSRVKLEQFRRVATGDLIASLAPGRPGALKARPDGTVLDGHHRIAGVEGAWSQRGCSSARSGAPRDARIVPMEAKVFWIAGPWKGRLGIVPRPRGADWLDDETRSWREAGIDVVVSLLESDEAAELALTREAASSEASGLDFRSFPIPDRGLPNSRDAVKVLVDQIVDALQAGKTVALHCRQSIGRSAMIAAATLIAAGQNPDAAIDNIRQSRNLDVPETNAQRQWISDFSSWLSSNRATQPRHAADGAPRRS